LRLNIYGKKEVFGGTAGLTKKGLSKEYMAQLKAQLDLKLALTLKFMNSLPFLDETIRMSVNDLKKMSDAERQKIIISVENAAAFAEVIAKEICPITAPMEA
jgi:hypothetical protein